MVKKENNKFQDELEQLSQIISGEVGLRKREESIKKAKEEAVENQKNIRRKNIVKGKTKLDQALHRIYWGSNVPIWNDDKVEQVELLKVSTVHKETINRPPKRKDKK